MKARKSLLFVGLAAAAGVLLLAVGLLLFRAAVKLRGVEKGRTTAMRKLEAYYGKDPFPSPKNVEREQQNTAEVTAWLKTLMTLVREGQEVVEEKRPSKFMGTLGDTRLVLNELSRKAEVRLPANFAFGFERYFAEGSSLPSPDHVPRLIEQLAIIEKISRVLCEEGVAEMESVSREEFEGSAGVAGRALDASGTLKNAGVLGENDLFAKLHFEFEFRSREKPFLRILNRLAGSSPFMVVTGVEFRKRGEDVRIPKPVVSEESKPVVSEELKPEGDAEVTAAPEEELSRKDRTVSGVPIETPMKIKMGIDVYRFREV